MIFLRLILACACIVSAVNRASADVPATEYFVVDSAKLVALASDDTKLDTLSSDQLAKISVLSGSYTGELSMKSVAACFRIDARFTSAFADAKDSIDYNISASSNSKAWDVCSEQGSARKIGKQFVSENWRNHPLAVVLRFLDLRH